MKRKNRPMALGLCIAAIAVLIGSLYSPSSHAVSDNSNRSIGVECQTVERNVYWDKRHKYDSHPLVAALGIGILVDVKGNAYTDHGKNVVILGDGSELDKVTEDHESLFLITK
ncbi:putative TMhelix containing protein [Vibrio phage 464E53-1]|nr:putative TMhelix containing protein [Vibrio phage 464E53-1]